MLNENKEKTNILTEQAVLNFSFDKFNIGFCTLRNESFVINAPKNSWVANSRSTA